MEPVILEKDIFRPFHWIKKWPRFEGKQTSFLSVEKGSFPSPLPLLADFFAALASFKRISQPFRLIIILLKITGYGGKNLQLNFTCFLSFCVFLEPSIKYVFIFLFCFLRVPSFMFVFDVKTQSLGYSGPLFAGDMFTIVVRETSKACARFILRASQVPTTLGWR